MVHRPHTPAKQRRGGGHVDNSAGLSKLGQPVTRALSQRVGTEVLLLVLAVEVHRPGVTGREATLQLPGGCLEAGGVVAIPGQGDEAPLERCQESISSGAGGDLGHLMFLSLDPWGVRGAQVRSPTRPSIRPRCVGSSL